MSNKLRIEEFLQKKLLKEFGDDKGEKIFSNYIHAKSCLVEEILPEIKRIERNLTDHGPEHIKNVLENAESLLGNRVKDLNSAEVYSLCLMILFHDVGIIWGRKDHHKNISRIYDYVRKYPDKFRDEKIIITTAVRAHTGTSNNSNDTLKDILNEDFFLEGKQVRLRDLAAILRFADELAEGRQRTSNFMIENHRYSKNSLIFQNYSNITRINIDKKSKRILIYYDINIPELSTNEQKNFRGLMEFCYKRIVKLDQEKKI